MNLKELQALIASLDPIKDKDLIDFYKKKEIELKSEIVERITKDIKDFLEDGK